MIFGGPCCEAFVNLIDFDIFINSTPCFDCFKKLNELMKTKIKADSHTDRYTDRFGTNDLQRVTLDCEQSTDYEPIEYFIH